MLGLWAPQRAGAKGPSANYAIVTYASPPTLCLPVVKQLCNLKSIMAVVFTPRKLANTIKQSSTSKGGMVPFLLPGRKSHPATTWLERIAHDSFRTTDTWSTQQAHSSQYPNLLHLSLQSPTLDSSGTGDQSKNSVDLGHIYGHRSGPSFLNSKTGAAMSHSRASIFRVFMRIEQTMAWEASAHGDCYGTGR